LVETVVSIAVWTIGMLMFSPVILFVFMGVIIWKLVTKQLSVRELLKLLNITTFVLFSVLIGYGGSRLLFWLVEPTKALWIVGIVYFCFCFGMAVWFNRPNQIMGKEENNDNTVCLHL
jgi:hypothetical protein